MMNRSIRSEMVRSELHSAQDVVSCSLTIPICDRVRHVHAAKLLDEGARKAHSFFYAMQFGGK